MVVNSDGKNTSGVYLRSQKLNNVKITLQPKMNSMLEEFGVRMSFTSRFLVFWFFLATTKPSMPTARNMAKYDELRQNICAVLDLKKLLDRAELDLKTAQNRISELETMDPDTRKASALAGILSDVRLYSVLPFD